MEFRLRDGARATKDMDLASCQHGEAQDGGALRETLIEALSIDEDGDGFLFQVSPPVELNPDAAGRGGWRFSIACRLAGRIFATVRLDIIARDEEIALTEQLRLPNFLEFAGTPPRDIKAVDRRQHFAEKLHAFTRDYGNRPNNRVKDLVDLVLLIESGIAADAAVVEAVRHVFAVRATHEVPDRLPEPPPDWAVTSPELAEGLTETSPRLEAALALVRDFWAAAATHHKNNPQQKV